MRQRTTKSVTVSLPPGMVAELDRIRRRVHRSRSELLRAALERFLAEQGQAVREVVTRQDEVDAIRQGKEDLARGRTVRLEDLRSELGVPVC